MQLDTPDLRSNDLGDQADVTNLDVLRRELADIKRILEARKQADELAALQHREFLTLEETALHFRISLRQLLDTRREDNAFPAPLIVGGKKVYSREQLAAIKRKLHIVSGFTEF